MDIRQAFRKASDAGDFERIENPIHPRPDLCAFIFLDRLLPDPGQSIVSCTGADQVWLDIDCQVLATRITYEDVVMLSRCGVRYDEDTDSLTMFV